MVKRVAMCEGASTDSDIADLPDIPFHPPVTYTKLYIFVIFEYHMAISAIKIATHMGPKFC